MAFPYSTRQSWVVKSVATNKTGTDTLLPFEIGLFDYNSCKTIGGFSFSPEIFIAAGSPNFGAKVTGHPRIAPLIDRNQSVSFKTDKFYGKNLLPARIGKPNKVAYPQVIYLGYDGVHPSHTLDFKCGKTYMVNVKLYGAAISVVYPKGIEYGVNVTTPDCDSCDPTCTQPNICSTVVDKLVTELNRSWTFPYVRAEKVISCCNTTALTPTYCREYSITLCDEGNASSLARLQAQYPAVKISIAGKVGTSTMYSFVQDSTAAAPAAYTSSDTILIGCATCPAGYTTVTETKVILVTIDNAGAATTDAAALAEVQTVIPTATAAIKTGFAFGTSSYVVNVPLAWVMPGAMPADTTIVDTGSTSPKMCTLTTPVSTSWVVGKQTYRVKRTLEITVDNPDCNGSDLAEIVAAYSNIVNVVPGTVVLKTAGTCKSVYELQQYSQCMEDGCDTLAIAAFEDLPRFKGHVWALNPDLGWTVSGTGCPIPPPTTTVDDCRCGVKLIGAFIDFDTKSCIYDPCDAVNFDQVRFEVSISEVSPVGEAHMLKPVFTHQTQSNETGRKFLTGHEVIREIIEYRAYRMNETFFSPNKMEYGYKFSAAEGQQFGVNVDEYYYAVYIPYSKHGREVTQGMHMAERNELALYFAESDYSVMLQFLAQYNKYISSQGINLPILVV